MKKLIKILLLATFLGIHPVSCDRHGAGECGDIGNHAYFISDIDFETKDLSKIEPSYSAYSAPLIDLNTFYHLDSIGFLMNFETIDLAMRKTTRFSGFQNMAIACSPSYQYRNPTETVHAIYVGKSVQFNDSTHINIGDTITNIFNFSNSSSSFTYPEPLGTIGTNAQSAEESFLIKFSKSNTDSLEFQFDLITTLMDGQVFKSKGITVKLLPSNK